MRNNSSGKILTLFLVIIAVVLVSLTAISIFFFQKEIEKRTQAESEREEFRSQILKLENESKEIKKQAFLLDEKNKEADERINSLMDDLELEKGLREQMKVENLALKDQLDKATQEKTRAQEQLSSAKSSIDRVSELEARLQAEIALKKDLQEQLEVLKSSEAVITKAAPIETPAPEVAPPVTQNKEGVDLEKIVVVPAKTPEGRILSVDAETEFVILNLGEKDGLTLGNVLSVYRGKDYLGDVKVTRVQSEMAAADFIPPFSSRSARKNDQVVLKQ